MSQMVDQVNGYDVYAKRAECDEDGNNVKTTYATKAELPDGVPAVTSSDDGKVLKATYSGGQGSYAWETESGGSGSLPAIDPNGNDNGKYLRVDKNGSNTAQWSMVDVDSSLYNDDGNAGRIGVKLASNSNLQVIPKGKAYAAGTIGSGTFGGDAFFSTNFFVFNLSSLSSDAKSSETKIITEYTFYNYDYLKIILIQGNTAPSGSFGSDTPWAISQQAYSPDGNLSNISIEYGAESFYIYNGFNFDSDFMVLFVNGSCNPQDVSEMETCLVDEGISWSGSYGTIKWESQTQYGDYGLKATAAPQVQADWNQSDSSAVDYIKNKPSIPAAQVNSDWSASSGIAEILNKPEEYNLVAGTGITITKDDVNKTITISLT